MGIPWQDILYSEKRIVYKELIKFKEFSQNRKNPILDISDIDSEISSKYFGIILNKDNELEYITKTGVFKIQFKNGQFMIIFIYEDPSGEIVSMLSGLQESWKAYLSLLYKFELKDSIPPLGFCDVKLRKTDYNGYVINYIERPLNKIQKYHVFHPQYNYLMDDITNFFKYNNPVFKKYNEPYMRRVLLTGEPGTGKTSIAYSLAKKFIKSHNISIIPDLETFTYHIFRLSKAEIPSIVILEDFDKYLNNVNSVHLNFLSGSYQQLVKKPVYVIYTTNHPERIDDNILARPERIDEIVKIDALNGEYAINCAKFYLENSLELMEKDSKIFDKLTGVQIKKIVREALQEHRFKGKDLDVNLILHFKKLLIASLKKAEESAQRRSLSNSSVGFRDAPF